MVSLRNLLRDDPPLSVLAVERQAVPGGIWTGHIPEYSTLQDLVVEYECHGVKFPRREPQRRASRDQVAEFCEAYFQEFHLKQHVLWQHDVTHVEMVKPMLHKVDLSPLVEGLEKSVSRTVYTRSVLVCTYAYITSSIYGILTDILPQRSQYVSLYAQIPGPGNSYIPYYTQQ